MNQTIEIRWHSRAGQGAMTAGQALAEIIGTTGKYVQAYPDYGAEKRGAPMCVYNRISDAPIRTRCGVKTPNHVIVLDPTVLATVDVTEGMKADGYVVLNTRKPPEDVREAIGECRIATLDASGIAKEEIGGDFPNVPATGALVRVAELIPIDDFCELLRRFMEKRYAGREKIIHGNIAAARRGYQEVRF
jgi:pyruvate ferredoxin oxidoreductase gamma subunit